MSVAVGLVADGVVYMGADSALTASDGSTTRILHEPKIFRLGPMVISFVGSVRVGQIVRFQVTVPKQKPRTDVLKFMVRDFVEAVRTKLDDLGAAGTIDGDDKDGPGGHHTASMTQLLVGYAGRLFEITPDFFVSEALNGMEAIGSGGDAAIGALYAQHCFLREMKRRKAPVVYSPRTRVMDALEAAHRATANVAPPFRIITVESAK